MKKLLLFLVMFFSFVSLFADWGEDLCEDVTCSGHGECHDDGEDEWCVCDEGYIADGLDCILGCNGVTCSGHGVCSVVSGAEVCTCEAGFNATGLNCILNEASTVDTLAILNETDCYNTGNCHYRLIFATGAYSFTPALSSLYDIIVNVLDSENVWHNYRKTVAQCVTEGVCDNVDAQYIDFWFQHNVNGNQYITVEILGNGDDASDDMYHDVLIDYCYNVDCGTGGSCDDSLGYPVCSCDYGYVLRDNYCEEGWFEDENLAAAVIELLQYKGYDVETEADIDPEMLENIETLALRGKNISSLVGIELFSSLTVLDISENNISDLSPLSNCGELRILNMSSNPANDLSPLSNLPLVSLNVSYSGVYNFNPLLSNETLSELIFADTVNGRHGMIRPDNRTVPAWLQDLNLLGCNEFTIYGTVDNSYKIGVIGIGDGCPAHGSCVAGECVCDTGYLYSPTGNTCFNPNSCDPEYHLDPVTGICENDKQYIVCSEGETHKKFPNSYLVWNGSEYVMPQGYTHRGLCKMNYSECDSYGSRSLCRWECEDGYYPVENRVCAGNAVREINESAYNQLILPAITRQDVALEPVPGVPSFAPVLKAEMYYDARNTLVAGWHLDLPRVELLNRATCRVLCAENWDQKTLYVYMPWGREEYSIETEKKCFNADRSPASCVTSADFANAAHLEITYYPAPGQNLFSYIVLRTTGAAYESFQGNSGADLVNGEDSWDITRYGEDGSVTEFYRGLALTTPWGDIYTPRPAFYRFMDYIPIWKHTTRDKKETSFFYDWEEVKDRNDVYSYYRLRSTTVVDPLKRMIKIESDSTEYGLMGRPDADHKSVYEPLSGTVKISVGLADSNGNPAGRLNKVVEYDISDGFEMTAGLYKSNAVYRIDTYLRDGLQFTLASGEGADNAGETVWTMTETGGIPDGYTETKLVMNDPDEYIVKTVNGTFRQGHTEPAKTYYSLENSGHKTVTVYSHIKSGNAGNKRIFEDYFTNWLQPAKRVTCERGENEADNCDNAADSVTEETRYNVSGSPIYFKNADDQVTVNLYNTTEELNSLNYMIHFFSDPSDYSNAVNSNVTLPVPGFIRADNLHYSGTLACSAVYSLDADGDDIDDMLRDYAGYGINYNSSWCGNSSDRRVTNYEWQRDTDWEKPYDLKTVTYPDGKVRTFTYDYETTTPDGYAHNGKIWGETITGSDSQNTLQTCYEYNENYQLVAQGIGPAGNSCIPKKGFGFDSSGLLMTRDYSIDENDSEVLENNYIYDYLGRKLVERNSAGVSTLYVYDSLDRVVFTFFGCRLDNNNSGVFGQIYEPYDFNGNDFAGEDGRGVTFRSAFPYNDFNCEYYRKYKYDAMSNLVETFFFEYWGVNANNQIAPLSTPKIIKQTTEYDLVGRAIKSCQYDGTITEPEDDDKRCIETEHDAFGNIIKKTENGEERIITYDLRNRPLTVTVDGLPTEQYSYSSSTSGGYFGYDTIRNKYENIEPLKTYKDKWGRAAKSVDPFGNNVEPHYNSTTWLTDYSKTYNGTTLTSFDAYEYDDLGRVSTIKKVLFDPASNTSNATATSINGIAAKEMVLEKSYSYDSDTGSVVAIEDSLGRETVNTYDHLNRIIEVKNYDADNQLVSLEKTAYDASGRISAVQNWTSAKTTVTEYDYDNMGRVIATCVSTTNATETDDCIAASCTFTDTKCSYQLYNTGGQVIWSADTESGGITNLLSFLNADLIVGNETVYDYNAFGEVVKTARRMTATGRGGGYAETQLYNSDAWITTNFSYDIFGRIAEKYDDNGAKTHYTYTANNLPETETYCGSDDPNCASPREVTYTYNTLRDLVSETYEQDNVSLTVNYGRDDYGRISQKYTGNTATDVYQTFTYNNRNLLETAKSVDPTNTTSTLSEVTRTYDSFGSIKSETFDSGTVSSAISWNSSTKVMTETTTLPTGKNIVETAFSGLPEALEYDGTKLLQYNYGTGNVLTSIRKNFDLQDNYSAELAYTYNNWRKVSRRTEEFTAQNAPTVADYEYTYSKGLHLIGKQENKENRRTAYQYDSYYRLRRVDYDCAYNADDPTCIENRNNVFKCNTAESGCEDFQLDGVHNIMASRENQTDFTWTVDGFNRLTEKSWNNNRITYSYDSNNNLVSEDFDGSNPPEIVYTYDKLNRLTSVTNSDYLVEYSYDPFNRRTEKTVYYADGNDTFEQTHKYAYNDWDIISEEIKTLRTSDTPVTTTAWQLRRYVDQGTDNHIIMDTVSCSDDGNGNCSPNESTLQRIWFHKDERGNIIAISDGNGTIYERYRYRVYGEHEVLNADFTPKSTAAISPFLWGGSLYEPETNLYWMRNRYYHIDMHRFINQDPIGIWGDANNLGNGFAYVAGMVIEASDPTGLDVIILVRRILESDAFINGKLTAFSTTTFEEFSGYTIENKISPKGKPASPGVYEATVRSKSPVTGEEYKPPRINYTSRGHQIHTGNFYINSDGCILLGKKGQVGKNRVDNSVIAVEKLNDIISKDKIKTENKGKIFVVILPTDYDPQNNSHSLWSNFFDLHDFIKNVNKSKNDKNASEQLDEKIKPDGGNYKKVPSDNNDKEVPSGNNDKETPATKHDDKNNNSGQSDKIIPEIILYEKYNPEHPYSNYPSDPDKDPSNAIQKILMSNILVKMLKRGEGKQPPFFTDTSTGPNGAIMIYRNPYYVSKDPLKTILFNGDNGSGKPMIYRNPFTPGAGYGYDATTYDKWQQSGFVQPNVDPYWY